MVVQTGKHNSKFLSVYDDLLPPEWCERMYSYALELSRPWGAYVTTAEALDATLDAEQVWKQDPEKALSLVVVRGLFFGRGRSHLEGDIPHIHGNQL